MTRRNGLRLTALALILCSLIGLTLCAAFGDAGGSPASAPLRVVMDNNYPPYAFTDDSGALQGILADQWQLWSEKTGRPVELVGMDWGQALEEMEAGRYDVIDTIFRNPQREKIYDFTEPYATLNVPIFFSNTISGITGIDSLKGFTVAAKSGDNAIDVLQEHGITSIVEYPSYEAIIRAAYNKEILVFVIDEPPARYFMAKYGLTDQFNTTEPLYSGEFHRAVAKGDKGLLQELKRGFDAIAPEELLRIERKWYGTPLIPKWAYRSLAIGLSVFAALVVLLIFWNRILTRRIAEKTRDLARVLEEVRLSESRIRALLKAVPDMIFILDEKGRFLDFQASKDEALYVPPEVFLNKTIEEVFPPETGQRMVAALKEMLKSGETQIVDYQLPSLNELKDFEARMVPGEDGRVLAIVRDVSEQKGKERQIYRMSIEDQLTGVYNRNHFETELMHYQNREHRAIGVILCDLDGLKFINDTLGHDPGDQCLKATARILSQEVGDRGTVSRIGGDEFGILMPDVTREELLEVKNRVIRSIQTFNEGHNQFPISLSFGIAVDKGTFAGVHDSVKEADVMMYREKLTHKQSSRGEFLRIIKEMLRDRESDFGDHTEQVRLLSIQLGTHYGLAPESLRDLELLAEFHDVGKIGIVDGTLHKQSEPTELEWLELKRHSEIGFRIAESSPDLRHIGEYILKHHEWWDGSGYPLGLKETEIPLLCRILAVVDAYDAMVNPRPYRQALTRDEAVAELNAGSGKQFDPEVVERFVELLAHVV